MWGGAALLSTCRALSPRSAANGCLSICGGPRGCWGWGVGAPRGGTCTYHVAAVQRRDTQGMSSGTCLGEGMCASCLDPGTGEEERWGLLAALERSSCSQGLCCLGEEGSSTKPPMGQLSTITTPERSDC
jgi:hypothetical protein